MAAEIFENETKAHVLRHEPQYFSARALRQSRGERTVGSEQQTQKCACERRAPSHAIGWSALDASQANDWFLPHHPPMLAGFAHCKPFSLGGISRRNKPTARRAEVATGSRPADIASWISRNDSAGGSSTCSSSLASPK